MANVVYRNVRHPLTADRAEWLKNHLGMDAEHTQDISYGDDPLAAVMTVVNQLQADGDTVVAVEAGGPEAIMIALAEGLSEQSITLIRQVFARGEDGRILVTGQDERGRDILAFDRYEAVGVEVRKALIAKPL